jgi:hypothetical protein
MDSNEFTTLQDEDEPGDADSEIVRVIEPTPRSLALPINNLPDQTHLAYSMPGNVFSMKTVT